MKYKRINKKIMKVWGRRFKIDSEVELDSFRKALINKHKKLSVQHLFKKIHSYDTDWETLDVDEDNTALYKTWDIEFNKFPKKLLPYIRVHFLWKGLESENISPNTNYIFKIEEENVFQDNNRDLMLFYNLRLLAGIQTTYSGNAPQIKTKILITLINPENYV